MERAFQLVEVQLNADSNLFSSNFFPVLQFIPPFVHCFAKPCTFSFFAGSFHGCALGMGSVYGRLQHFYVLSIHFILYITIFSSLYSLNILPTFCE